MAVEAPEVLDASAISTQLKVATEVPVSYYMARRRGIIDLASLSALRAASGDIWGMAAAGAFAGIAWMLNSELAEKIHSAIHQVYTGEPLPEHFTDLLHQSPFQYK